METFEQVLKRQLQDTEQHLHADLTRRLRQARYRALAAPPRFRLPRLVVPALGMVTASIVAIVLVVAPPDESQDKPAGNGAVEQLSPDSTEFYEDLDFYYWLAESAPGTRS
ncbi:MAG: hypothetical protein WDA10_11910 [Porticoccaceae bacterium]|jgi:hypothetical protein|nr:hypothetical protein [Porticoccaceae bacterium]